MSDMQQVLVKAGLSIGETKDQIIITVDKNAPAHLSKSAKTQIVATTGGFVQTPSGLGISLNVNKPLDA